MKKRAEISTSQLVAIILAVVGFVILVMVLTMFYPGEGTDKEICRESVILRATTGGFANLPSFVPLSCVVEKSCITSGLIGGNCKEEFENTAGVNKIKIDDISDIDKFFSEQVVDCWTMMGQGKVSLFDNTLLENYGYGKVYPTCVICSRIAFDAEALAKKGIDVSKVDVETYMKVHKVPGKDISYYQFLAGGEGTASFSEGDWSSPMEGKEGEEKEKAQAEMDVITQKFTDATVELNVEMVEIPSVPLTHEKAVVFMQITAPTYSGVWKATLTTLGAGFLGANIVTGGGVSKGLVKGAFFSASKEGAGTAVISAVKKKIIPVLGALAILGAGVQAWNIDKQRGITAGYCGDVSYGDNAREGCSVVRLVDYNLTQIKEYCSVIESKNN